MQPKKDCPLCETKDATFFSGHNVKEYTCSVCGSYQISEPAEAVLSNRTQNEKQMVNQWCQEQHQQGIEQPNICYKVLWDVLGELS